MTLRVNLRRTSRQEYLAQLQIHGLDAEPAGEAGLILNRPVPIDQLPGFAEGLVSVQDLAAQYAAPLLDARTRSAGARCLCCARRQRRAPARARRRRVDRYRQVRPRGSRACKTPWIGCSLSAG